MASINLPRPATQRRNRRARRETAWFYFFISPWLLGFLCLSLLPLLFGFAISLSNFDGLNLATAQFVGLDNYMRAFRDPDTMHALTRTATFALILVPLNLVISLVIAALLTQPIVLRNMFRVVFYIPSIIPVVAVVWIWKIMMDNNFGLANALYSMIFPDRIIRWLTQHATLVLVMLSVWVATGGAMIIFLAALQGIPKELEEAARIDGANPLQIFTAITLPLLTPVIFYQLILSTIVALQTLAEPILLSPNVRNGSLNAMPPRDNYLYMVHVYHQIFSQQRFGYGSALLWILFVCTLVFTLIVFRTSRHWVYYENEQEGGAR